MQFLFRKTIFKQNIFFSFAIVKFKLAIIFHAIPLNLFFASKLSFTKAFPFSTGEASLFKDYALLKRLEWGRPFVKKNK